MTLSPADEAEYIRMRQDGQPLPDGIHAMQPPPPPAVIDVRPAAGEDPDPDIEPDTAATDGSEDEYFPPPSDPMAVSRRLLGLVPEWRHDTASTLRYWRSTWMRWEGAHWAEVDGQEIRATLYQRLEHAEFVFTDPRGDESVKRWAPSKRKIADVVDALGGITHLSASVDPPAWIDRSVAPEGPFVACANGLLHVPTRTRTDHEPGFFNLVSVPFDFDRDAPPPKRWLEFLDQVFADDEAARTLVQEFFGYVLSGRTDQQKILLLVGPTRSGKGTIARILTALVGKGNVAGPTLASLGTNFGLSPLLGKPLAIVSDARLDPRTGQQVVETLLRISGEDMIDVDRKYRDPWSGRLPTRFMILSNELPKFGDDSGVVADRFFVLSMATSFLGREETGLTEALAGELPGILNWALDGLVSLDARGRFAEPDGSADARLAMRDMASPVSAFVRECCDRGPDLDVPVEGVWAAWKVWCEDSGNRPGNKATLGRNLQSVAPTVRRTKPRADDGKQTPTYAGIALRRRTHSGETPGSPGSPGSRPGESEPPEPPEPGEPGNFQLSAVHEQPELADARPGDIGPCLAGCGRSVRRYGPQNTGPYCPDCKTTRAGER
ncbi:DNA primase family protein [Candidatus Frankia nodulisporulans]|uniref:DNA primase family protein n=1 Tax=Candidatus Frankia nodulisporulans TaxID=2060052 RepID=UPI001CDCA7D9|nr:phage/plasmid primase, P4 family [Candidatus Frankia nodulisporulans]